MSIKTRIKSAFAKAMMSSKLRGIALDQIRDEGLYLTKQCGRHTFVFYPGDHIGDCLARDGQYQRGLTERALAVLKCEGIEPRVVLEIGANIGTQTAYFFDSPSVERVVSVEPDPENVELLKMNIRLNGLADRVKVVPVAASAKEGELAFARYRYNSGRCAIVNASSEGDDYTSIRVRTLPADAIATGLKVDFLWIDVEEHEIEVLKGMSSLLGTPMLLEFSRHAMSQQDFEWFRDEVLPHYNAVRAFEEDFAEVTIEQMNGRDSQYNLLLT